MVVTNNHVRDRESINQDRYNKLSNKEQLIYATFHITHKLKEKLNLVTINDVYTKIRNNVKAFEGPDYKLSKTQLEYEINKFKSDQ